jgi:hypothetical protein
MSSLGNIVRPCLKKPTFPPPPPKKEKSQKAKQKHHPVSSKKGSFIICSCSLPFPGAEEQIQCEGDFCVTNMELKLIHSLNKNVFI